MELQIYDYSSYDEDISAQSVYEYLHNILKDEEGLWMYKEPEMRTTGNEIPTFTVVGKSIGLYFIRVFPYGKDRLTKVEDKYWVIDGNKLTSEILKFRNYIHAIKNKIEDPLHFFDNNIEINICYYFPYINKNIFENVTLNDNENIKLSDESTIELPDVEKLSENDYKLLLSIIQHANIINKVTNSYIEEPARNMREAIELNNKKIATFDNEQLKASLTITDKCERIRGLAGSGKTVLLAMKAAKLHNKFPNKKIAFIFYTKSLYYQAIALIRRYYNIIADDEPNWDNLLVLHSWGGITTGEGFYSYVCKEHNIKPRKFSEGSYEQHCIELLKRNDIHELFDFVLIDEAQDFPLKFFNLVYRVTKEPKKIVVAYDELQSTNDIMIPEFETLFGKDNQGNANVILESKYDYILKKSYRNTLDVLVSAFSFGFGFYAQLTQIIQDPATWEALGFECNTLFLEGTEVTIKRPKVNSPNSILDYFKKYKPISYEVYDSDTQLVEQISQQIFDFINEEKVDPIDIMIIDIRMNSRKILNQMQYYLGEKGIESHIPGIVNDSRDFFKENKVTLTTPRNAKGNEVSVVFVVGCEEMYITREMSALRTIRNFMFISMTRSKGWLFLAACGRVKGNFSKEIKSILSNMPNIKFSYPPEKIINELGRIDFLTNNPKAKTIDSNISILKKAMKQGDETIVKQLIDMDVEFKNLLLGILKEK